MNAQQQHGLHMELNHTMNPVVQSFRFPGTTFPFRNALVIPGHVERLHDGDYFDADGRPFLWTNPDSVGAVMHRYGTRRGTVVHRQPEQGMREQQVGEDPRRGMDGSGRQQNAIPDIVAQSTSTSVHHIRHPPPVPFIPTVGPSFPLHPIPRPSIVDNPPRTHSTRDTRHQGSTQSSTATTIDPQLRSLLWNDETSALSKWYDETLDVRRAPTRASPHTSQQLSSAAAASIAVTGQDGSTLGHDRPSTAEASLPVNQEEGIEGRIDAVAEEQATQEPHTANDPAGVEQEKADASTAPAASKSGAPKRRRGRPLRKSAVVRGETWDESEFGSTEQLKQSSEPSDHINAIGKPLQQGVPSKPRRVADVFDGSSRGRWVKGKGTAADAVNTGEPPVAVHAQHGRRWNAPADLNLVLGANVSSTFAMAQMPPLTAPATSNGLQLRFSPDPQHSTQHHFDSPSLTCWILPVEDQSALPVHEQPFAVSVDEYVERVLRHDNSMGGMPLGEHALQEPYGHEEHGPFQSLPPGRLAPSGLSAEELVSPKTMPPPGPPPVHPYQPLPGFAPYYMHGPIDRLYAFPPRDPGLRNAQTYLAATPDPQLESGFGTVYPHTFMDQSDRPLYPSSVWTSSLLPTFTPTSASMDASNTGQAERPSYSDSPWTHSLIPTFTPRTTSMDEASTADRLSHPSSARTPALIPTFTPTSVSMKGASPVRADHPSMPSGIDQSVPEQEGNRMNRLAQAARRIADARKMISKKLREDLETIRRHQSGILPDQGAGGAPCLQDSRAIIMSRPATAHPVTANAQPPPSSKRGAKRKRSMSSAGARPMSQADSVIEPAPHTTAMAQQSPSTFQGPERNSISRGSKRGGRGKRQNCSRGGKSVSVTPREASSSSEEPLKGLRDLIAANATPRDQKDEATTSGRSAAPSRRASGVYQLRPPSCTQPRYDFPSDDEADAGKTPTLSR